MRVSVMSVQSELLALVETLMMSITYSAISMDIVNRKTTLVVPLMVNVIVGS